MPRKQCTNYNITHRVKKKTIWGLFLFKSSLMNSQFNTALKRVKQIGNVEICFGGIQFNTALKHVRIKLEFFNCFGGIQFNTALKLKRD